MKRIMAVLLTAAIAASAFAMAGCDKTDGTGESKSESSSDSKPPAEESSEISVAEVSVDASKPKITHAQIQELSQKINDYRSVPEFISTAGPVDADSVTDGKKIAFIPDNTGLVFTQLVTDIFKDAADTAGFDKVITSEADGTAAAAGSALSDAVEQQVSLAMLFGDINKDSVSSYIEVTQANGIEVLSAGCAGVEQADRFVDYTVPINYELAGELMADWTIIKNSGRVNALAINRGDSVLSGTIFNGFKKEFETCLNAESGYCTTINASSIEIGNGLANKIKQALQNDTNINYIIVMDDSMISDAVSAADQAGSKAKIISTGGSPEAFDAAQNGNLEMLVAQSYEWIAYAAADYAVRVLAGGELPKEQDVPLRIITADSIAKDISSYSGPDYDHYYEICFGAAYVWGYYNLWNP